MTEPLTPTDCDLRGLEYMPLLGTHLFGSEFNARANDSEWRAALTLWWAAWTQQPAASLPDDDAALCRLADLGRDMKTWRKVKAMALYGFVKCSDGRLYHKTLAKQALLAWDKRVKERQRKAEWRAKKMGHDADVPRDKTRTELGHDADVPADETRRDGTGRYSKEEVPFANANAPEPLPDADQVFWENAARYVNGKRSMIGKWVKDHGKDATAKAITEAQLGRVVDPVSYVTRVLRKAQSEAVDMPLC